MAGGVRFGGTVKPFAFSWLVDRKVVGVDWLSGLLVLDMIQEDNNTQDIIEDGINKNTILAYEYTESVYKDRNEALNNLNGRLATLVGFGGLLLRFTTNLPGDADCPACLLLKAIAFLFSLAAILLSVTGIRANRSGVIVKPRELMTDYWYNQSDEIVRCRIINTWVEAIELFEEAATKKGDRLNRAIQLLAVAIIAFALDIIIANIFPI